MKGRIGPSRKSRIVNKSVSIRLELNSQNCNVTDKTISPGTVTAIGVDISETNKYYN